MGRALTHSIQMKVPPQGRLTLQTATPVMTTTQSAKTTIFYTPYVGDVIPIYDGVDMVPTVFTELSVLTTDTTKSPAAIGISKVNDWFVWNDAGTIRLGHGPDWTSDTVRSAGTAIGLQNGIWLNNIAITNGPGAARGTYVGTTRSNGSSQLDWIVGGSASGGTAGFLGVWNTYNRVMSGAVSIDGGTSYTYTSAVIRQARASAGMQVSYVVGVSEEWGQVMVATEMVTAAVINSTGAMSIGLDSITVQSGASRMLCDSAAGAGSNVLGGSIVHQFQPAQGFHYVAALENSDGTHACTFNNAALGNVGFTIRM